MNPTIRAITANDSLAVATIHAASWRSAYKGMLRDAFLQSDLLENRLALWSRRLSNKPRKHFGFIAVDDTQPIGFAFAFGDEDPTWGTQLDNLHVLPEYKGKGLGKRLLLSVSQACDQLCRSSGMFLWVYEANVAAQSFYACLGARRGEKVTIPAPGGGRVSEVRYSWPSVVHLARKLSSHDA